MCPRPFATMSALPARIRPIALRVEHTWMGSKFAFSTRTGSCIGLRNLHDYTARFLRGAYNLIASTLAAPSCSQRTFLADVSVLLLDGSSADLNSRSGLDI